MACAREGWRSCAASRRSRLSPRRPPRRGVTVGVPVGLGGFEHETASVARTRKLRPMVTTRAYVERTLRAWLWARATTVRSQGGAFRRGRVRIVARRSLSATTRPDKVGESESGLNEYHGRERERDDQAEEVPVASMVEGGIVDEQGGASRGDRLRQ